MNVLLVALCFNSEDDFDISVCNIVSCQSHGFKQVVMLTHKKWVLLLTLMFNLGINFKVFVWNNISCQCYDYKQVIIFTPKKKGDVGSATFLFGGQF